MEDNEVKDLKFSESEIENFAKSRIWKQIVEDVLGRALLLAQDLEEIDPVEKPSDISKRQGGIANLKWVADLPMVYLAEVQMLKKVNKEEKEKLL